jgi:hypothetical protein
MTTASIELRRKQFVLSLHGKTEFTPEENEEFALLKNRKYSYKLSSTGYGSDKFGPCEVCGGKCDTTYRQAELAEYDYNGKTSLTAYGCVDIYGHEKCLIDSRICS